MKNGEWEFVRDEGAPEKAAPADVPFELAPLNLPVGGEPSAAPAADLDLRGQAFPLPLLAVHRKLGTLPAGAVLQAACDTQLARENFTAYAQVTGSLVEFDQFASHLVVKLRRKLQ